MKVLICSLMVTCALGARLDNTYLPPAGARTAGGSSSFLSTPTFAGSSSGFRSSGSAFSGISPATSYGAPSFGGSPTQYSGASSYSTGPQFRILKFDSQNPGDGSYRFDYETENQISQHEAGEVRNAGSDQASSVVRGSYSYTAPDGQHITVNYVADENGFRPEGAHLPTPPPIPEDIQKSLATNAASSSGSYQYPSGGYSDSGAYDGVEISAARSTFSSGQASGRQYLPPTVARAGQGYRY
ncbi:pupal cuticle protein 20-like [Sitophilus oryzae]|uniref:Pupal cuticle protein 20-like n=1 Tax=Sitophilus oryzae TaxID=7048 RepID=A0A6J2XYD5_SITOR|nr:pupal cuticle protein 20-like [Sitophilus oryzae]